MSKNAALIPPAFGSPSAYTLNTGTPLTPNLAPGYKLNREQKKLEGIISQIPPELLAQLTKNEREARKNQERGNDR